MRWLGLAAWVVAFQVGASVLSTGATVSSSPAAATAGAGPEAEAEKSGASEKNRTDGGANHHLPAAEGGGADGVAPQQEPPPAEDAAAAVVEAPPSPLLMVPDAEDGEEESSGGSKKRRAVINYASMDAGAIVLASSPTSKGFSNLLLDDKDKYGNTPCADKKMVVIGLSEDIQMREVILAQYEKYSSHVKEFDVLGSQTYPTREWLQLGSFTAKYGEREQTFTFADPKWVRYLKFRFLSHYGDEFVCTISQIKVHGATMMEGFHSDIRKHEDDLNAHLASISLDQDDDDDEETDGGDNNNATDADDQKADVVVADDPAAGGTAAAADGGRAAPPDPASSEDRGGPPVDDEAASAPEAASNSAEQRKQNHHPDSEAGFEAAAEATPSAGQHTATPSSKKSAISMVKQKLVGLMKPESAKAPDNAAPAATDGLADPASTTVAGRKKMADDASASASGGGASGGEKTPASPPEETQQSSSAAAAAAPPVEAVVEEVRQRPPEENKPVAQGEAGSCLAAGEEPPPPSQKMDVAAEAAEASPGAKDEDPSKKKKPAAVEATDDPEKAPKKKQQHAVEAAPVAEDTAAKATPVAHTEAAEPPLPSPSKGKKPPAATERSRVENHTMQNRSAVPADASCAPDGSAALGEEKAAEARDGAGEAAPDKPSAPPPPPPPPPNSNSNSNNNRAVNGSLNCLEVLDFKEFKERKLAKTTPKGMDAAVLGTGGAQFESIFKTLMDKIKASEIHQQITELYLTQLQQCYAQRLAVLQASTAASIDAARAEAATMVSEARDLWAEMGALTMDNEDNNIEDNNNIEDHIEDEPAAAAAAAASSHEEDHQEDEDEPPSSSLSCGDHRSEAAGEAMETTAPPVFLHHAARDDRVHIVFDFPSNVLSVEEALVPVAIALALVLVMVIACACSMRAKIDELRAEIYYPPAVVPRVTKKLRASAGAPVRYIHLPSPSASARTFKKNVGDWADVD